MKIIQDLERSKNESLALFDLDNDMLDLTYGDGKWSIRFILHHLADAETVLYERVRRTISRPGQVMWGFDPDAWATNLDYEKKPLLLSQSIYAACRNGIIYLAEQNYEAKADHHFVHNETGIKKLTDVIDKVVWHNERHLAQIRQAVSNGE